jgi:hypothetical protein
MVLMSGWIAADALDADAQTKAGTHGTPKNLASAR